MSEVGQLCQQYGDGLRAVNYFLDRIDEAVERQQTEAAALAARDAALRAEAESRVERERASLAERYKRLADKLARYGADPRALDPPTTCADSLEAALGEFAQAEAVAEAAIEAAWQANIKPI